MIPNFFIMDKEISAYMICALIGVFACLFVNYFLALRSGKDEVEMLIMTLVAFTGSLVGAHLLYGITNFPMIVSLIDNFDKVESFSMLWKALTVIFGGAVYYGGLIGALVSGFIYMKCKKLDLGAYSDIGILGVLMFHFFGRIGCFLSGCCYGKEWEHGITYHYCAIESANGVPRFPVQLVEAAVNLILFITLYIIFKKGMAKGKLLAIYLVTYPVCRFILEFFRGDEYRGFLFGLSTSQIISILLFVPALIWLIKPKKQKDKAVSAKE